MILRRWILAWNLLLGAGAVSTCGQSARPPAPSPAPASSAWGVVDPSSLSGTQKRQYDALMLISGDADKAMSQEERRQLLSEYLNKSSEFVAEQPRVISVWLFRAVAALETNRADDGIAAGKQLVALGADNSADPATSRVMAMLDRRDWLSARPPATQALREKKAFDISDMALTMLPIPPGRFLMGSTKGLDNEKPVTTVTLTRCFWLGKTEITQGQWGVLMDHNPSRFKGDDLPVESVSWIEAVAFCRQLTEREQAAGRLPKGYAFTLPTEAQWEYACRAGTTDNNAGTLDAMAWYAKNSGGTTHEVAQKQSNEWGVYDMHGNVWEWCLDWYGVYPGGSVTDPTGSAEGDSRVCRGGGWGNSPRICRSSYRGWDRPETSFDVLGFRVALVPLQ
jgi:formylglycine-generating enzyme required for sulfatase activity